MHFAREINRLLIGLLIVFGVIAVATTYWAIVGADTLLPRSDNPRLVEAEAGLLRGAVVDRADTVLVETKLNDDDTVTRRYLYPEMYSALGYASLRYGVSGAEAAYNILLRGDDLQIPFADQVFNSLAHHPRQGSDIRLTFDLAIQTEAARLMDGHRGAVVVLAVPTGEVLAMLSLPTYDPNTLDADWEQLTKAPGNLFFNRALQGAYQPGGTLQTPLLAAALLTNYPLDTITNAAVRPVRVGDVQLNCVQPTAASSLTLREAYASGCPAPFAELINTLGLATIQAVFDTFQINLPPTLPGYIVFPPDQPTPTPETVIINGSNIQENALGQGRLTITPFQMAIMAAAVVNDGNAPTPYTLLETRLPNTSTWIATQEKHPFIALMTANTARQLQDAMRFAVSTGSASSADQPGIDIGGHATLAYSGAETQAWFIGFATLGGRQGIAIAVVVENSSDASLASSIGGSILAQAYQRLR